jgi:hypothetical protein
MGMMLTLYSSAHMTMPMRRKAGKDEPATIDQPSLVVFGTAIPNHYYQALSERMLTNGFFGRMIILEAGPRGKGKEPKILNISPRVLEQAQWWADYQPTSGNIQNVHPEPTIIEHTPEAQSLLIEIREEAEVEYTKAESGNDVVGTTVWGRVNEHVRKLALIYAISENYRSPQIGLTAVTWAREFMMHQTRRMLFMASAHVADNPFHALCLKMVGKLREARNQQLPHSQLLKRMKIATKDFQMLVETLQQQGEIDVISASTKGRPIRVYRLTKN